MATTPISVSYPSGKILKIEASQTFESGGTTYGFSKWIVNDIDVFDNPYTFTVDRNFDIMAVYTAHPRITVSSNPELHVGVYIDGVLVGTTPITVEVQSGNHTLGVASEVVV